MAEVNGFGGFAYYRHHSTTAFFFLDANTNHAELFNLQPQHLNLPPLYHPNLLSTFIPHPITILSSSHGFILCRDIFNSYHIFDPLSDPLFCHTRLPNPRRPHADNTPAVVTFQSHTDYRVICAIDEGQGLYTFDTFSSDSRTWNSAQGPINLDDHGHIRMNTGVSCRICGYWLTDGQRPAVVRHDPESNSSMIAGGDLASNNMIGPGTRRLQLGRVANFLGLVVVKVDSSADFYALMGDAVWMRCATTIIVEGEDEDRARVEPLRFESFKWEVLFLVGRERRLVMWECDDQFSFRRMVTVPGSENIWAGDGDGDGDGDNGVPNGDDEVGIANGVPYILPLMPWYQQFLE